MKKLFTLFFIALCILSFRKNADAQLLLYDDFTGLTTASNLAGQSSWTKGGSGPDATVQNTTPLTYTDYNGGGGEYVQMPAGNATTSRVYKGFLSTAASTNTFFYSVLVNISSTSASSNGYFMTLGDPTTGTNYFARLFAQTNGTGYSLGISKFSNTPSYGSRVLAYDSTYAVIVRYTFVSGSNNDSIYMWINPDLSTEPLVTGADVGIVAVADPPVTNVGNFIWHNRGTTNPTGKFDAVRVAYGASSSTAWTSLNSILPVELSSFTSITNNNNVNLKWSTVSEENNSGFDIERKSSNGSWMKIGNVNGNGTSNNAHTYLFEDKSLSTDKYNYRLKQIDYNGNYKYYDLANEVTIGVPAKFELSQNYPNPFNPSTIINYQLAANSFVSLKIFDVSGREVMQLVNEVKDAGYYSVNFNASKLSSGMYFYKLQSGDFTFVKKMMLVK